MLLLPGNGEISRKPHRTRVRRQSERPGQERDTGAGRRRSDAGTDLGSACGAKPTQQAGSHEELLAGLEPVALNTGDNSMSWPRPISSVMWCGNVGGGAISQTMLMGVGIDPHSYVPAPSDIAAIHDAHVVFSNGVGLEGYLDEMFDNAGGSAGRIPVSKE